jgi:type IV pilus assembly protein PilE
MTGHPSQGSSTMNLKHRPRARGAQRGFTLIEIMIVVAIVAVLFAIMIPSYREYVARGKRAEAKAAVMDVAQWIERQYTVSRSYLKTGGGADIDDAALALQLGKFPTVTDNYTITFGDETAENVDPDTAKFSLRLTPKGSMANDKCGSFVLKNTGEKLVTGEGQTVASCWGR